MRIKKQQQSIAFIVNIYWIIIKGDRRFSRYKLKKKHNNAQTNNIEAYQIIILHYTLLGNKKIKQNDELIWKKKSMVDISDFKVKKL